MKNNIIYLYILYIIIVYLLFIIDITVLMYYIFWINNVFINPLLWLCIKIIYYNRTILLLLLFYYFIAKYTIKQLGYKYFYFFNIDVRKWRLIYLNYLCNITIYHIEIISILLFFFVIIIPLLLHNKEIFFSFLCILIFLFLWWIIFKNRFKYVKGKKIRIRSLLFFLIFIIIFLKLFNYQYIKDLYTMYVYLDKWVFELLEWKIKMYSRVVERDIYDHIIGLKPVWIGEKLNKKEAIDNKLWELLSKKKKINLIKEFKYKLKRIKWKYYLYFKYYEKVLFVKNGQSFDKISKLRKNFFFKNFINYKNNDKIKIKEYSPKIDIRKENPVITQEKEKERALHRTVATNIIHKFSIKNYYRLNLLLKELTLNQLYYQPFIDKKGIQKQIIEEKRHFFLISVKERVYIKEDLIFFKNIMNKVKKNLYYLKSINKKIENNNNYYNKNKNLSESLLNYLMIEKKIKKMYIYLLKVLNIKDIKFLKKKEKLSIKKFLRNTIDNINLKDKMNKLYYFNESKKFILNKDKIEIMKKNSFFSFSKYVERNELEKFDNKLLYNTIKKYNEEKTKVSWKNEFSENFILKEKKNKLTISDSPDLSRRNKK